MCSRGDAEASGLSLDAADVPLQWLVLPVVDLGGRRHPCDAALGALAPIWEALAEHEVTHLCGAPIVMSTILNAPPEEKRALTHTVEFFTAAAPPPEAVLAAMAEEGFNVTHLYGLTETYGPAVVNDWKAEWDALDGPARAAKKARQGVRYHALEDLAVMDPETMARVPADGETLGEVMFRGNVVMKGYLKNPEATEEAFKGGWFHSGDLGVMHPDGYIQLKDRSKDIIISGGENISSIEVEDALYKHPGHAGGGGGGQARREMGRNALRLHRAQAGQDGERRRNHRMVPRGPGPIQVPKHVVFAEMPKTSTGKIQKFKLRGDGERGEPAGDPEMVAVRARASPRHRAHRTQRLAAPPPHCLPAAGTGEVPSPRD